MKKFFLILLMALAVVSATSQKAVVESFEVAPMDVTAQKYARLDLHGEKCALVKVIVVAQNVSFQGNLIGDVPKKGSEYWVYLTAGTKMMRITADNFMSMMYNFPEPLQGGVTYILTLQAPQNFGIAPQKPAENYLVLKVNPAHATVFVDGAPKSVEDGVVSVSLPDGPHTYRVELVGYAAQEGTVTMAGKRESRTISLVSTKPTLTITAATPGTEIYINDARKGTGRWSGQLFPDTYVVEGRLAAHRTHTQKITLTEGRDQTLAIPALAAITGSLNVNYKPVDATITVDGRNAGVTPNVVPDLLVGDHTVVISKDGYTPATLTATVSESAPATLSGSLTPLPAKKPQQKPKPQGNQSAIEPGMLSKAPMDSEVLKGQLSNGLTYYIRHNATPKGKADFFIAQNVGSILEEENERGTAHFLEHMCFNSTEHFPGNGIISWLESRGVKFGQDLNAYTGMDETVYNISNVPVKSSGTVDSCLLVLHDWADGMSLNPKEIDAERNVIHEEWRRSMVGQMRLLEKLLPKVYPGSKYGKRLPIGLMSVVDNITPRELRNYYEKWYRPDNQAIIVVGDVDPEAIESKIERIFGSIQMPANPAPRVWEQVPDNPGTIYAIGSDKDQSASIAYMFFKLPQQFISREMNGTVASFPMKYLEYMLTAMMNERFSNMASKSDCPFAGASIDIGQFLISPTKDALTLMVVGKGNDIRPAFEVAYRELLRASKNGFTQSEYDRAKAKYLANYESGYEQRANRDNTTYAREYAASFTKNEPIPGIAYELEMAKQVAAQIPFQAFQQLLPELIGPDNRVFMALLPEKAETHIVTEPEMAAVISKVESENLSAK